MASKTRESPDADDRKLVERSQKLFETIQSLLKNLEHRKKLLTDLKESLIEYGTKEKLFDTADLSFVDEELQHNASWIQTLEKALEEANAAKIDVSNKVMTLEIRRREILDQINDATNVLDMHPSLMNKLVEKHREMKRTARNSFRTIVDDLTKTMNIVIGQMCERGIARERQ